MSALPVSICIPVRNEEKNLPGCFQSLQNAFDEVVVVDSVSTDATRQISQDAGATVLEFRWNGMFPKKRNWTLQNFQFKHPWVLFVDADERLTTAFIEELRSILPNSPHVGYWLTFNNWFMGRQLKYGDVFKKLALFRTSAGRFEQFPESWWSHLDMEVHEHPVLEGTIGQIQSPLEHHDYRGLEHYISKHNQYSTWESHRYEWLSNAGDDIWNSLTSRQRFKYKNLPKWWLPWVYFLASYVGKRGFLDGYAGWTFARLKMRYFDEIRLKIGEAQLAKLKGKS